MARTICIVLLGFVASSSPERCPGHQDVRTVRPAVRAEGEALTRDPHYDMVKRINSAALAIGEELVKAKSIAVYTPPELDAGGALLL